jgi:hypothetical protein
MRKFFLSIALALLLVGTVAVPPAEARWRDRGYYYGYPAYGSYYGPAYGGYYAPGYSYYGPAYYYPRWRYR